MTSSVDFPSINNYITLAWNVRLHELSFGIFVGCFPLRKLESLRFWLYNIRFWLSNSGSLEKLATQLKRKCRLTASYSHTCADSIPTVHSQRTNCQTHEISPMTSDNSMSLLFLHSPNEVSDRGVPDKSDVSWTITSRFCPYLLCLNCLVKTQCSLLSP